MFLRSSRSSVTRPRGFSALRVRHRRWWFGDALHRHEDQAAPGLAASFNTPRVPMTIIPRSSASFRPSRSLTINWSVRSSAASMIASRSPGSSFDSEESALFTGVRASSHAGAWAVQVLTISGATGAEELFANRLGDHNLPIQPWQDFDFSDQNQVVDRRGVSDENHSCPAGPLPWSRT